MPVLTAKEVHARAQQALAESTVYAVRDIIVKPDGDTLILVGRVSSFYHKQVAQELVRQHAEGVEVVNQLHVQ